MASQHRPGSETLGEGGPDVVLPQHSHHARPRHPRDEGHEDQRQRQRGQGEVPEEGDEAGAERRVALHGQETEPHREQIDEEEAQPEHRHGEAGDGQAHDDPVHPGALPPGGEHAEGNRRDDSQQHGQDREGHRRLQSLLDEGGHGQPGEDRGSQVATQELPQPDADLHEERAVQAERGPDTGDVLRGRVVARDDRGGIAGREAEQGEDEQGHDAHDGDGREEPAENEGQHPV